MTASIAKTLGFYLYHVIVSSPAVARAIRYTCGWERLETHFVGNSLHDGAGATNTGIWQLDQVQSPNVGGTNPLFCCCTGTADTKAYD